MRDLGIVSIMEMNSYISKVGYARFSISSLDSILEIAQEVSWLQGIVSKKIIIELVSSRPSDLISAASLLYKHTYKSELPIIYILLPQLTLSIYSPLPSDYLHTSFLSNPFPDTELSENHLTLYSSGYVDGTFDHLHCGHLLLLTVAAVSVNLLTVGITPNKDISHKAYFKYIQPWEVRAKRVRKFLNQLKKHLELRIIMIEDSVTEPGTGEYDAIFASSEPGHPFTDISIIRQRNNLPPLVKIIVDVIETDTAKFSSSQIRKKHYDEANLKT